MNSILIIIGITVIFIVGLLIYKFYNKKATNKTDSIVVNKEPITKDYIRYNDRNFSTRATIKPSYSTRQENFSRVSDNDLLVLSATSYSLISEDSETVKNCNSSYNNDSRSAYNESSYSSSYDSSSSSSDSSCSSSSSSD